MTQGGPEPAITVAEDLRMRFHAHSDETALVADVGAALLDAVLAGLEHDGKALVLLSGGSTPIPVYRAVAARLADLRGLTIGLVDDRWVAPDSPGSNATMIRDMLRAGAPADANVDTNAAAREGVQFWPLVDWSRERAQSVALANERLQSIGLAPCFVLFGMGDDGHTASLFPGSPQLDSALASADAYVALDADGCPGAGKWPHRITLTPRGWLHARRRVLLIRGTHKREVLERAAREADARTFPVRAALAIGDASLDVHWCP